MNTANRRMAALVCMAGVLPVVVLGLQTGGNGAFRQREVRGDLRRAEKPLIVDNEREVKCGMGKFGRIEPVAWPAFLPYIDLKKWSLRGFSVQNKITIT